MVEGNFSFLQKKEQRSHLAEILQTNNTSPILGKILERVIKIHMMTYLENMNYFEYEQCGFREQRGKTDALKRPKFKIDNCLTDKKYFGMVSFDIESAF